MPFAPPPLSTAVNWWAESIRRFRTLWLAKAVGITAGMTIFFCAYFWLLNHPLYPPTYMPLTALDRWVPFWPPALVPYLSLWVFVTLAMSLQRDVRHLVAAGLAWIAMSAIALTLFLVWPTSVPPRPIEWHGTTVFSLLGQADAAGNACPSLHVAFALLSAVWLHAQWREIGAPRAVRIGTWLWSAVIIYSTLATHQHVATDVLAGAALGSFVTVLHRYLLQRSLSFVAASAYRAQPSTSPPSETFGPIFIPPANRHGFNRSTAGITQR